MNENVEVVGFANCQDKRQLASSDQERNYLCCM